VGLSPVPLGDETLLLINRKEKMTIGVNELFKDAIKNVRKRFVKEVKSDTVEIFNRVMELQEQGRDVMEMLSE